MTDYCVASPVTYKFTVRDNRTGEVRLYNMDCEWFEHSMFFLTEGNFGCDCNRGMSFARAGGATEAEINALRDDEDEDDRAFPCGDERYTILKAILSDGREIEIDNAQP